MFVAGSMMTNISPWCTERTEHRQHISNIGYTTPSKHVKAKVPYCEYPNPPLHVGAPLFFQHAYLLA